jgi:hypothetical protein
MVATIGAKTSCHSALMRVAKPPLTPHERIGVIWR